MVQAGNDALCIFLIQRGDCTHFAPSWENDAKYSSLLAEVC
jgi:DNA-binding sugar fermentation-stimulating protein